MEATISISYMFIHQNDFNNVKTQFNDPKFGNFYLMFYLKLKFFN